MKGYEGGIAVFIFKILVGLSVHLRAKAALASGKYYPVGLVVERRLSGTTEAVWTLSGRDKYLSSKGKERRSPDFILWLVSILRESSNTL
jgi:hypothetical protein